ncbi:MAG: hypothetical protein WEF86_01810 [Gemmatimonadota bacterium]
MKNIVLVLVLIAAAPSARPAAVHAQTRADTAAVLLQAAEQLTARGETGAARALLGLISDRYAGTPAAASVEDMLVALRQAPDPEQSGRTELLVAGTGYGAWLGVAVPLMLESESSSAYGVGLLLGAPAGFLAARRYADATRPTEGQARAITFGGTWGTYQGVAWTELLDIGQESQELCDIEGLNCTTHETDPEASTWVAAAVVGGLAGIGTGAWLARKPITPGTAAAVTLGGMWGTWFGFAVAHVAGLDGDDLLAGTLIGGNAALVAAGLLAPSWQLSENRARLISIGGVIGGLAGGGALLILQPDDDKVMVGVPALTSAAGLLIAAQRTRPRVEDARPESAGPRGALLNIDRGKWAVDLPAPSLGVARGPADLQPALYLPLVKARF